MTLIHLLYILACLSVGVLFVFLIIAIGCLISPQFKADFLEDLKRK